MTLSLVLGSAIGVILGLTGAGGGMLAVPALVASMGWTMQQAAPVALIAVAVGAAIGAAEGFMRNLVRYRAGFLIAAVGIPAAWLGTGVAQHVSQYALSMAFAVLMIGVGVRLLRQAAHSAHDAHAGELLVLGRINPDTGRFSWSASTAVMLGAIGAIAGFMTGLLGVGGGFVIVPLLRRFTDLAMHGIVATSLFVVALVGTGGILAAAMRGSDLQIAVALPFAVATAAGIVIGRILARRLPAQHVQRGFGLLLVIIASGLLVKTMLA